MESPTCRMRWALAAGRGPPSVGSRRMSGAEAGVGDVSAGGMGIADGVTTVGGEGSCGAGGGSSAREQASAEQSRMGSQRGGRVKSTTGGLVQVLVHIHGRPRLGLPLGADEVTEDGRLSRRVQDCGVTVALGSGLPRRRALWGLSVSVSVALVTHEC